MLERHEKLVLYYSLTVWTSYIILALLRETRIDVYLSINILAYFIILSLLSPMPSHIEKRLTYTSIIMILIFSAIVAYRIILILGGM